MYCNGKKILSIVKTVAPNMANLTIEAGSGCTLTNTVGTFPYVEGSKILLQASVNSFNWQFAGWYINGKVVSTNTTFEYTMPATDVTITAKANWIGALS